MPTDLDPAVLAFLARGRARINLPRSKPCAVCGTVFKARGRGKYCSTRCRKHAFAQRKLSRRTT